MSPSLPQCFTKSGMIRFELFLRVQREPIEGPVADRPRDRAQNSGPRSASAQQPRDADPGPHRPGAVRCADHADGAGHPAQHLSAPPAAVSPGDVGRRRGVRRLLPSSTDEKVCSAKTGHQGAHHEAHRWRRCASAMTMWRGSVAEDVELKDQGDCRIEQRHTRCRPCRGRRAVGCSTSAQPACWQLRRPP